MTNEELLREHGWLKYCNARGNTGVYWTRLLNHPHYKGYEVILFAGHDGRLGLTCNSSDNDKNLGLKPDEDIHTFDNAKDALIFIKLCCT